jgi:glycosyltransferase involved in cell wall biosynthesis
VVFSGTNPALLLILISLLKVIKGFKWMLLVHDVFPENLIAAKVFQSKSLLYRFVKYLFDKVYSSADTLIAIGRDMQILLKIKTKSINRIEYVPNWVDPNDVYPLTRDCSGLIHNHGFDGKVVFQFFGNLGRLQGIQNLLDAILLVENEKAAFMFIGSGSEDSIISNFIKNNPKKSIIQLPSVTLNQNNFVLSSCDVSVVSLSEGMNGLGVPSKAYFSLAADKPLLVITDENSELFYLISEEYKVGWFCEACNPIKLALMIDEICRENISDITGNSRNAMLNKYTYVNAIKIYTKCISELHEITNGTRND